MKKKHELTFYQKEKKIKPHHFKGLAILLFWMAAITFIAFVTVLLFGKRAVTIGGGMEPVLYNTQEVLINRTSYVLMSPKEGDVIAFFPNGNNKSHYYIKRVVAVPGDVVYIENGHLYVNGYVYKDEGKYDYMDYAGIAENEITLKNNEYFVLGDNRNDSEDSRYSDVGLVNKDYIEGKVWFRFKSNDHKMGFIN